MTSACCPPWREATRVYVVSGVGRAVIEHGPQGYVVVPTGEKQLPPLRACPWCRAEKEEGERA